jgi:hypothetical protein
MVPGKRQLQHFVFFDYALSGRNQAARIAGGLLTTAGGTGGCCAFLAETAFEK